MANSEIMEIFNPGNNLMQEFYRIFFTNTFATYDIFKELSTPCILHDQV
jgi:hypothetical protein